MGLCGHSFLRNDLVPLYPRWPSEEEHNTKRSGQENERKQGKREGEGEDDEGEEGGR